MTRNQLYEFRYLFENVDAALATLTEAGGFRRFIRLLALGYTLSGTVRRTVGRNLVIVLEGTVDQHNNFMEELLRLVQMGMISNIEHISDRAITRRLHNGFIILADMIGRRSRNRPNGVEPGPASGIDHEIASTVSAVSG